MTGRATLLPVALVLVIVLLAVIAIASGRSNAPDIAGDDRYPHHVCTFNDYCVGETCSREPLSFVIYLQHEDGQPRIELRGFAPRVTMTSAGSTTLFESRGGEFDGTFTLSSTRKIDVTGQSRGGDPVVNFYGTGECERLRSP